MSHLTQRIDNALNQMVMFGFVSFIGLGIITSVTPRVGITDSRSTPPSLWEELYFVQVLRVLVVSFLDLSVNIDWITTLYIIVNLNLNLI